MYVCVYARLYKRAIQIVWQHVAWNWHFCTPWLQIRIRIDEKTELQGWAYLLL